MDCSLTTPADPRQPVPETLSIQHLPPAVASWSLFAPHLWSIFIKTISTHFGGFGIVTIWNDPEAEHGSSAALDCPPNGPHGRLDSNKYRSIAFQHRNHNNQSPLPSSCLADRSNPKDL